MTLTTIKDFDLSSGRIVSTGYLQISWIDELLVWNPENFGDISKLSLEHDYNWKPGLAFDKNDDGESLIKSTLFAPTWVSNNGIVVVLSAGSFETVCDLDTTQYPFDSHSCNYRISTNYDITEVVLQASDDKIDLSSFTENGEWYITETECKHEPVTDKAKIVKVSTISNVLQIKRRSGFVMLHVMCPLLFLDILGIAVCLVPPDSGERISFSVTMFLSFVFLSSSIVTELPRNSLKLTSISMDLLMVNIFSTCSVLWSIYIVRLSRQHDHQLPSYLKYITDVVNRIRNKENDHRSLSESEPSIGMEESDFIPSENRTEKENVIDARTRWQNMLKTLDSVYFVINLICYGLVGTAMSAVFIVYAGNH